MDDSFEETTPNQQPEDSFDDSDVVDSSAEDMGDTMSGDPTLSGDEAMSGEETTVGEPVIDEAAPEPDSQPTIRQSAVVDETDPDEQATTARPSIYDDIDEEKGGLPIIPIIIGGLAALCGLVLVAGAVVLLVAPGLTGGGSKGASEDVENAPTPTLERTLVFPTATIGPTEVVEETEAVEEEQTDDAEGEGDGEAAPTDQPTATTAPVQQAPTNPPPPPPPTNTPVPPAPTFNIPGLTGVAFAVSNPTVGVNQRINFTFSVTNEGDESIIFGPLGVAVQDANGTTLAFHTSWTRWELKPDKTENWTDGVAIGDAGSYRLELSACIPKNDDHCDVSGGDWYVLAPAIAVTVN